MVDLDGLQDDAESDHRRCAVGALIRDGDGRVFVHRRGWQRQLLPGCWDIVGGHVEAGESLVDALAREVEEETGWQLVGTPRLMFVADWETSDGGRVDRRREFDFLVDVDGDLSRPRLEWPKHVESTWVGHTDLALLDENRGVDDGLVRQLVTSAHYWPRSDRPSHPHVTLFLRGPAADGLERVRHRWDPVMADAIHIHVTIAYPQDVAQVEEMIDRTRRAAASIGPVQLRLGEVDHDDDAAWLFVHVEDVHGAAGRLRSAIVGDGDGTDVTWMPHVTLVHPRTSNRASHARHHLGPARFDGEFHVDEVAVTALVGHRWRALETFSLTGAGGA